jgi:anti-sigma factor RsiW
MVDEQLEFAISQYADGTLPPSQSAALEAKLGADPALAALLAEYRELGMALQESQPLPSIDWKRLTSHLSGAIAEADADDEPVRIYAMPWVRRVAGLAVAACLAIALVGVRFEQRTATHVTAPVRPAELPGELAVAGPAVDAPAGPVVKQISIGPSPAVAMNDSSWRYSDSGVVAQPQRVVIATSDAPVQDTPVTPY